ncbi:MAG: FHA domain-containing protein [Anaerolineae bacterium]|nr:FHA domain-containing protein [Anaerolineae bacterium]
MDEQKTSQSAEIIPPTTSAASASASEETPAAAGVTRRLHEIPGIVTDTANQPDTKELPGINKVPPTPEKTSLLPPGSAKSGSDSYRTHVVSRAMALRRMLAVKPTDKSRADLPPRKIRLIIRGIGESYRLSEGDILLIGRNDFRSGGFSPDVDLGPLGGHERGVSRAHARLHLEDGKLYVTDLYSSNGTYLHKEQLKPEKPYPVFHSDELLLGAMSITVEFE